MPRPRAPISPLTEQQKRLAEQNVKLVYAVVDKFKKSFPQIVRKCGYHDMVQEGMIVLCNCAKHFNPSKAKFSTYVFSAVYRQLFRLISHSSVISIPLHGREEGQRYSRFVSRALRIQQGFEDYDALADHNWKHIALRRVPSTEDEEGRRRENLYSKIYRCRVEDQDYISLDLDNAMTLLDSRCKKILSWSYGIGEKKPQSNAWIGKQLGISRERVRQIKNEIFDKLRNSLGEKQ